MSAAQVTTIQREDHRQKLALTSNLQIQEVREVDRPQQKAQVGSYGPEQDVQESPGEYSPPRGAGEHCPA